jgi:hypothetical protein
MFTFKRVFVDNIIVQNSSLKAVASNVKGEPAQGIIFPGRKANFSFVRIPS